MHHNATKVNSAIKLNPTGFMNQNVPDIQTAVASPQRHLNIGRQVCDLGLKKMQ